MPNERRLNVQKYAVAEETYRLLSVYRLVANTAEQCKALQFFSLLFLSTASAAQRIAANS